MPKRLYILPLRFKKSILNTSIFRGIIKTVTSVYIYSTRTILYRIANKGLKRLEELVKYRYPIYYYYFRR
jgi:Protein of unknown function (DUF3435)